MMKVAYVLVSTLSLAFVILLFLPFPWDNPYGYGFLGELIVIDLVILAIGSCTLIVNGEKGKDVDESLYIISVPLVHIFGSMVFGDIMLIFPLFFILYKCILYFIKSSNVKN